jgi:hypothetical protein
MLRAILAEESAADWRYSSESNDSDDRTAFHLRLSVMVKESMLMIGLTFSKPPAQ